MKHSLTLVLAAGIACISCGFSALAQPQGTQPAKPAAAAGQPATAPAGQPATAPAVQTPPPNPKAIPVPDLPIVKKTEIEGGIIAEDMKIGDGYEVKPGGVVVAHYHGTLKEGGTEFDSSFKRGDPITFPLTGVIAGWSKGVPGMKVGGIRKLTIPAALGYGAQGSGALIPPNSDLVFVIQLVGALEMEDLKVGEGEAIEGNCVAVTAHVIKDADGKEIEKVEASKPYIWIPGEFQPMQFGLEGMKPGGKRKLVVPKEMNVSPPQANSTRPQNVPITMEIELIAARNLGGGRKR